MVVTSHRRNSLAYVREQRKLSKAAVAKELGTSVRRLDEFEAGERTPSLRQFENFARIYGVSDYILYGTERPNLEPLLLDFRRPEAATLETSPKGLAAYFDRLETANLISSLASALKVAPERRLNKPFDVKDLGSKTQTVADWLGFDPTDPDTINNPDHTIRKLRYEIEKFNVFLFLVQVPPTDYRGLFSPVEHNWGMCLVNKRTFKPKARIFTIVHEFAHFLTGKAGASDPLITVNAVEKACNEFTSEFMAPPDYFDELKRHAFDRHRSLDDQISFISSRCLLSKGATAYRLREEGKISRTAYRQWLALTNMPSDYGAEDPPGDADEGEAGGRWAYNVISDLGYRSVEIVKGALNADLIDEVDAGRILNARGDTLEDVFHTVDRRVEELDS